uniref:Sulfotransferase domain-containing protein n=1 Tax=Proboscia inermis TaxID=420281 RepID=A0A7S0BZA7_9STRA|mmetsp:Transcript_181/g.167  ORF Transcript_181/g.167 Transcript_181/m.167 type:complete len:222 (+) Transcript_181:168-833(+)
MSSGGKFVDVDTTNRPGILRAKEMSLVSSNVQIETLVTPFKYDANKLFDPFEQHGRLFSFFRHPIDRAVSLFSCLKYAEWEPSYNPAYKDITIEEFAEMELGGENKWMTREFSNQREGELTDEHLEIAIDVCPQIVLVGLLSKRYESMKRFEKYFGWKYKFMPTNKETCRADWLVKGGNKNENKLAVHQPGSPAYKSLSKQYHFDILLFDSIDETLFWEQK